MYSGRARIAGHLDMIRASDKVFDLNLDDGHKVRGIWLGDSVDALRNHLDRDVVVNGMVAFRPSGTVLRIDAETIDPATTGDERRTVRSGPVQPRTYELCASCR